MTEQDASEDEPADERDDADGGAAGTDDGRTAGRDDGATSGTADGAAAERDGETAAGPGAREDAGGAAEGDDDGAGGTAAEEVDADADESAGDDDVEDSADDDADLVERVRESEPEETAREIAALRDRVDGLESDLAEREAEREELESKLKRKQADFQNFKRRQEQKREEATRRATEDLVERLLDVHDNLVRALDQDEDVDIRDGVETTRRQFDRVLEAENVEPIDPEPGAEVDPQRHEVLMRVESEREPGTVDEVHRPGYEMAGKVLRPAQVTVAED